MRDETGAEEPATGNRQQALRRGADIAERLLAFGLVALRLAERLPKHGAGRHVAIQLVRAGTGAGANYEEARAAESRADFAHKLGVSAKEMREASYWIGLIQRSGWVEADLRASILEASELAAILCASQRTARSHAELDKTRA